MALKFPVNIPLVVNKFISFHSFRKIFPKTVRLGALSGDREKLQKYRKTHGRTVRVGRSDTTTPYTISSRVNKVLRLVTVYSYIDSAC